MSTKFQIICIILLAAVIGFFHYDMKERPDQETIDQIAEYMEHSVDWTGKIAADFEVALLDGTSFTLSDHIGTKVIVLNFFTTWCGPCKKEMPELSRFYTKNNDQNFLLIGIDAEESEDEVRTYIIENKLSFPVGIDQDGDIQKKFGVSSYPSSIVIGVDGTIQLYEVGAIANADVTFANIIEKNRILIEEGKQVDKETFLKLFKNQETEETEETEDEKDDEIVLEGRAEEIAATMGCPCGCEHILKDCECNVADKIMNKLKSFDWADEASNKDIIEELNKEFCVGGNKDD